MTYPEIRHVRHYIVSNSLMMPLDEHDRNAIAWFRDGVDAVLTAVRNGKTAVRDAEGFTPLDRLQAAFAGAYLLLNDSELRDLLHAQWNWLIAKGVLP
ncbi:hypothetical protein CFB89_33365 [Burkholderia sp. AU16741]|uniref:hypothetical protein n=2 Tax=Burkholderia TaxID=32008 RepID=UPI000B79D442|nr:hypothetical protein [Burkholderia sp. AU16741]OXI28266.1 hypothetical protein CFB89_33365 [Burkholderia sp. AU16741]